jgi:DNA-binding IclR family transcriptional regulator
MSQRQDQLRILSIIFDRIITKGPQLVSTETIAEQIKMPRGQLKQLLMKMNNLGMIQSDVDLQRNLITGKGLQVLGKQHAYKPSSRIDPEPDPISP